LAFHRCLWIFYRKILPVIGRYLYYWYFVARFPFEATISKTPLTITQTSTMRKLALTQFIVLCSLSLFAQQNNFWTPVSESSIAKNLFAQSKRPDKYKLFQLNTNAFRNLMVTVPNEKTVSVGNSLSVISFPDAEGTIKHYKVVEAPVMHPDLAARYPGIYSYAGQGVEDPSSTIRFDLSPLGIHAMILSTGKSTIYIDPLDDNYYRVVSREDVKDYHSEFHCLTENANSTLREPSSQRPTDADDGKLRTYRLALISNGEFSQHWLNGTEPDDAARKAKVLAAQNSHMTRANAVFERDFGVRLVLVANNDAVIFLDPATDPFTNPNSPSGTAVQTTNDGLIGTANYDIGHLESKGNDNGNAGCIGCVCTAGTKGRGWTVYSNPSLLDFFVIDYLTHEMGHQLGANHTFTFSFEGTWVQTEPGSGTTIMGYAGITGSTDVQPHSDEYFHGASIDQVTSYIKSASGSCAAETNTGNTAPVADAGPGYIIPRSTPFKLTGTASDINAGDVLTYCWEQIDAMGAGSSTFPSATATAGPQFRSYLPVVSQSRTFPQLSSILNNVNGNQWEVLPSVARILNFRLTVKDNHPGGGATKSDDMQVTVSAAAGPFTVTAPASSAAWTPGTTQTVTWDVSNTTNAPVNCSQVNILLSTDGGFTFPTVLAANTANDGSQDIIVPSLPSTTCRVKVEAVGNIFFDISAGFTITVPAAGFDFNNPAAVTIACGPVSSVATLNTTTFGGFTTPVILSSAGNPPGTTVNFSTNPVTPGNSTDITLSNAGGLAVGIYTITVTGIAGSITKTKDLVFVIQPSGPQPVINNQPASSTVCRGNNITLTLAATGATSYQWRVSNDGGGTYNSIPGATGTTYTVTNVQANQRFVCVAQTTCNSITSAAAIITVADSPTIAPPGQPQPVTLCVGSNPTFTIGAQGFGPYTYQWQVSTNGGVSFSDISGANASTLGLSNITAVMNNNRYRCFVNGLCAPGIMSAPATLTVISPVSIATQPSDVTICETGQANFNVVAAANPETIFYQWQISTNGGTSYSNMNVFTPAYSVTASPTTNNNLYRVLLSNTTCPAPTVSDAAKLIVNARPTVTLAASPSATLLPGQSATITATIVPSAAGFNISWFKNNVTIPGITGTSYVVDSVEIGDYSVYIINQTTGCNNLSNILTIGTTASERLFIFPTPNNGQFTVSYYNSGGGNRKRSVTVYDAHGAKKYSGKFTITGPYQLLNINLRPAAAGIYIVVVGDENGKKLTEGKVMVY